MITPPLPNVDHRSTSTAFTANHNDCQRHFGPFRPLLIRWHPLVYRTSIVSSMGRHYHGNQGAPTLAARQLAWRRALAILTDALLVQEREICVIHQSRSLEPADHGHGRYVPKATVPKCHAPDALPAYRSDASSRRSPFQNFESHRD